MRRTIAIGTLLVLLVSGAIWLAARNTLPAPAGFDAAERAGIEERTTAVAGEAPRREPAPVERSAVDEPVRVARSELPAVLADPAFLATLCSVTGRVVDPEGDPVVDLEVSVHRVGQDLDLPGIGPAGAVLTALDGGEGRTDADGRFTIGGLWPGFLGLSVELSDGRGRRQNHVHSMSREPHSDWSVVRSVDVGSFLWLAAARIVGRVAAPDGEPLADARVRLVSDVFNGGGDAMTDPARFVVGGDGHIGRAPWTYPGKPASRIVPVETRTGVDGSFAFDPVDQGGYLLGVWAEGAFPRAETPVRARAGETRDVGTLVVAAGFTLRGRVVGGDGRPVAGVELVAAPAPPAETVDPYDLPPMTRVSHWSAAYQHNAKAAPVGRSRADGTFEVAGLPSKLATVGARRGADRPWTIANRHPVGEPLELRLRDEVELAVTVLGPDGRAVDGAELAMAPSTAPGVQVYGRSALAPLPAMELSLEGRVRWTGGGVARIDGLARTAHWIGAWRDGIGAALAQVDLEREDAVTLRLEPGRLAHVLVLDGLGAPLVGARLTTRSPTVFGSAHRVWGFTGRDGRFTVPCISGDRFALTVEHPSYRPRTLTLEVPVAESILVVLGQDGAVTGEVLVGGKLLEEPAVWEIALRPERSVFLPTDRPLALRADGTFEIHDVPPGRYRAVVVRGPIGTPRAKVGIAPQILGPGWEVTAPEVLAVPPGAMVRARIEIAPKDGIDPRGRATFAGCVVGKAAGVTGLEVALWPGLMGVPTAPVGADGTFELEVAPGRRTLCLFGAFDGERCELWKRQLELRNGERTEETIELVAPGRVSGVVRGPAGVVLPMLVFAHSGEEARGARTAKDGAFAFKSLRPGTYTFEARSADRTEAALVGPIEVPAGGRIDGLEFELAPCVRVSGSLPAAVRGGLAALPYRLVLRRGTIESTAGVTEDGRFLFGDVLPGHYRLLVVAAFSRGLGDDDVLLTHRDDVVVGRSGVSALEFAPLDQGR